MASTPGVIGAAPGVTGAVGNCVVGGSAFQTRSLGEVRAVRNRLADVFLRAQPGLQSDGELVQRSSQSQSPSIWTPWMDVRRLSAERETPDASQDFGYDGGVTSMILGIDHTSHTGRVSLGGYVVSDRSGYDISIDDSRLEADTVSVGVYAAYALGPRWVADGVVSLGRGTTDIVDPVPGNDFSFDTSDVVLSANMTGTYELGTAWRISPSIGLTTGRETEEAHRDALDQEIEAQSDTFTTLTTGIEVGRPIFTPGGLVVEPFGGVSVAYDLQTTEDAEIFGDTYEADRLNLSANVGVTGQITERSQFTVGGALGNLTSDDDVSVSAGASFSLSF
ncbi:MAG: autotransporter outer membrane beta-barrel domain-containing protein [Pseudomonadota bacterium]